MSWGGHQQPAYNPTYQSHGQNHATQGYPQQQTAHQGYIAPQQHSSSTPYQQQHAHQQQGYGAHPPHGAMSTGADPTLWHWFQAVDMDHSGGISATELRQALINGNWSHFNDETCRLMIGMFDKDRNGTINFNEFAALWKYIQDWKNCFERFDQDRSGNIDASELNHALGSFGYNLSPAFCSMVVQIFDRKDVRTIKLDDFIQCCVMIGSLTAAFRQKDNASRGIIRIQYEEFLEMVLENGIQ